MKTLLRTGRLPTSCIRYLFTQTGKSWLRVAICDQLEDQKQAKGNCKAGVTELVTPGVATSDKLLEHNSNNFNCPAF